MKVWCPRSAPVNDARAAHGVARPALFTTGIIVTQQLAMIPCRTASAQHRYGRGPTGITGASTHKENPPGRLPMAKGRTGRNFARHSRWRPQANVKPLLRGGFSHYMLLGPLPLA